MMAWTMGWQQSATGCLREPQKKGPKRVKEDAFNPIAATVLMKTLYAARMARFDLLRAIGALASRIMRWTLNVTTNYTG